jgi:uncharacterized protein (TIGR00730 family)
MFEQNLGMEKRHMERKPYELKSEKINRAIEALVSEGEMSSADSDLLTQMITTVLKLRDEAVERGDLKILNTTLKELRWAFKVYSPYRQMRKVTIFGSARTPKNNPWYKSAKEFGRLMAQSKWMVITGGASGIMEAGNAGAGRSQSFGANIRLPFEQSTNLTMENDKKSINFKYFFTRKLIFVKESDAICLYPGGFGTLDEAFETLTLIQTGKMTLRPIVAVDPPGSTYWHSWLNFVKSSLLKNKMIDKADMSLFQIVKTAKEARDIVLGFYRHYHSMRFVGDVLVIRAKSKLSAKNLDQLNKKFKDIIVKGKIEHSLALPVESNELGIAGFPRLVFHFDRRSYGRLKQMIDEINNMGE